MPTDVIDALAGLNVAEAVFLAAGLFGVSLVPFFALVDFDPRALVESGRLDWLLIAIPAVKDAVRGLVLDAAALLILLTTSPKEAMAA